MSRIVNILLRARDSLADHAEQRWSDDRLLRLVDEAQKDIARHSKLLKGVHDISLRVDVHTYELPDDMYLITRAAFDDCPIGLVSYDSMDEQANKDAINRDTRRERTRGYSHANTDLLACWELDSASYVDRLIFDNRNMGEIRVYPTPSAGQAENDYTFQQAGYLEPNLYVADSAYGVLTGAGELDLLLDDFGVVVDADSIVYFVSDEDCSGVETIDDVAFSSPYGIATEILDPVLTVDFHGSEAAGIVVGIDDYTADSVYGIVTDLYDPDVKKEEFNSTYGVATGIAESEGVVRIWYVRLPKTVVSNADELELPPMYDSAIRMYVVGNAFLDDHDAAYRQKGLDVLNMYDRELNLAKTTSSIEGVKNPTSLNTSYRGPFE